MQDNRISRGLQILSSSLYDPSFYAAMRERSVWVGLQYVAVVGFLLMFIVVSPVWMLLLSLRESTVDSVVSRYPDELVVTLSSGVLAINQPEPYVIPNPIEGGAPRNLLVFNTKDDEYTPRTLAEAEALLVLKRTFALAQGETAESPPQAIPYGSTTPSFMLNKEKVVAAGEYIKPYVRPAAVIGGALFFVLAVLVGGVVFTAVHAVYLLIPALAVYVYFVMTRQSESLTTAYLSALYASLPIALISAVAALFGGFPAYAFTALVVAVVVANRWNTDRA